MPNSGRNPHLIAAEPSVRDAWHGLQCVVDAAHRIGHSRALALFHSPQEAAMTHQDLAPTVACAA